MPSLSNSIHNTTIAGQIYSRGTSFYPPIYRNNFVQITMNNFQMMKQISRFETKEKYIQGLKYKHT